MKVGDSVNVVSGIKSESGKIVRFHANHGTVLVEMDTGKLVYFTYERLEKK